MVRLSKKMDYTLLLVGEIARQDLVSASFLAEKYDLSGDLVAVLLKNLCRKGFVSSVRGKNGGYRLARDPEQISLNELIRAVDGPIHLMDCSKHGASFCRTHALCRASGVLQDINRKINTILDGVRLNQMIEMPAGKV